MKIKIFFPIMDLIVKAFNDHLTIFKQHTKSFHDLSGLDFS